MISCQKLYEILQKYELTFFTGVPDSTFKEWLSFLNNCEDKKFNHILACNETTAIAIATGYHMATNKIGVVYLQNSGLGNTVNPLTSLADAEVYSIPMILFIGWRGRPGQKDEPQHQKMGRITLPLLDVLEIPYRILPDSQDKLDVFWQETVDLTTKTQAPVAVIIPKKTFSADTTEKHKNTWSLQREDAIKAIIDCLSGKEAIVSTTGKISRELYEYRTALSKGHGNNFYTVGSLGCSTSIALGIALAKPDQQVLVFDADGSALMHTGSWSTVGHYQPKNLKHIVFDNEAHESTGAQPSNSQTVDFAKIAIASGYKSASVVTTKEQLLSELEELDGNSGPDMLIVKVKIGSRADLGRPTTTPINNKKAFMEFLNGNQT